MPELSFEDLLDDSPVKKAISDIDDPLGLEDELNTIKSDTLNTPGPKRPPHHMKLTSTATRTPTANPTSNTKGVTLSAPASIATAYAKQAAAARTPTTTTTSAPVVLNSRNILPKSVTSGSQLVKISPKILVAGTSTHTRSPTTSTGTVTVATAATTADGKTAIKTANGQILYIQKKTTTTAGSSGGTACISAATSNAASTAATTTAAGSNKTVAFKLMRAAGGSLVPFKSTTAATTTAAAATVKTTTTTAAAALKTTATTDTAYKNKLTLSPKVASQLTTTAGGKRVISTTGGQVVIKTSLAGTTATTTATSMNRSTGAITTTSTTTTYRLTQSGATTSNSGGTATTTTAGYMNKSAAAASSGGHKIFVQSANGKQILVSNQQLIKLSPKPPTPGGTPSPAASSTSTATSSTTGTTTARQMQSIQLPGKSVQYLRVLSKGKSESGGNAVSAATSAATLTSTASIKAAMQSTNPATSTIKILNAAGVPPKFTVVRPSPTGSAKLILTQSPKKDGSMPVTFSPITSKVQKTIVTVPNLRAIGDGQRTQSVASTSSSTTGITSSAGAQLVNANSSQSLIRSNSSASTTQMRKHKISEINSELKRITTTPTSAASETESSGVDVAVPPEAKKLASGSRIVMLPRSMLRTTGNGGQVRQVTVQSNAGTADSNNGRQSPTRKQPLHQQQQKQQQQQQSQQQQPMQSVLKSNNNFVGATETNGQKSLLINGKTQALIAQQQQQHKTMQLKKQMQQQQQNQQQQQEQEQQQYESNLTGRASANNMNNNNNNNSNQSGSNGNSNCNALSADNKLLNFKIKLEPMDDKPDVKPIPDLLPDAANGGIRRKHCNCSKSQCLKLYCDCFANGEFCQDCTCKDCFNNLSNEDQRQRAIKNCLERNPSAFKPKITTSREQGDMRHNKGCNCKRSGCLKNYCECYEAKIPCSSNCKCIGCRNIEERPDLDMDPIDPKLLASIASVSLPAGGQKRTYDKANSKSAGIGNEKLFKDTAKALAIGNDLLAGLAGGSSSLAGSSCSGSNGAAGGASSAPEKQQCNFITQEVVDATIQCMISQADECEKNGLPAYQTEKMVMEEMGRCLVEIIDFSIRNTDSSFTQD